MSNLQSSADKAQMIELLNSIKIPIMGAGGGFAPIGREGYQDGQTAPQGWLICDGSTHNIADYPELAAYIASHHGSTNYYGGDGVTTFAVPTRSGMPSGGVKTPDEHIVGEWRETVDGVLKRKPVYEKYVFNINATPSYNAWVNLYDATSLNVERLFIVSIIGGAFNTLNLISSGMELTLDNGNILAEYNQSTNVREVKEMCFQYTKTTDEWQAVQEGHSSDGNGVFCIKATDSDNLNPDDKIIYDETGTERKIGYYKYANGTQKPMYEKTIVLRNLSVGTSQSNVGDVSSLNIDKCSIPYAMGEELDNGSPNGYYYSLGGFMNVWYRSQGNFGVKCDGPSIINLYITIQYTKTTDTPS